MALQKTINKSTLHDCQYATHTLILQYIFIYFSYYVHNLQSPFNQTFWNWKFISHTQKNNIPICCQQVIKMQKDQEESEWGRWWISLPSNLIGWSEEVDLFSQKWLAPSRLVCWGVNLLSNLIGQRWMVWRRGKSTLWSECPVMAGCVEKS